MPEANGSRTTTEWLIHLDTKLTAIHDKLDTKADATQVKDLEKRTRHLEVKQVGLAATASAATLWIKTHFFS